MIQQLFARWKRLFAVKMNLALRGGRKDVFIELYRRQELLLHLL